MPPSTADFRSASGRRSASDARPSGTLYGAIWRWHFYAGLLVLPFLVLLAVTGGIYLFRHDLDPMIHRDLMRVEARATPPRGPQELVDAALTAHPGTAFRYLPPSSPVAAAEVGVKGAAGERTTGGTAAGVGVGAATAVALGVGRG